MTVPETLQMNILRTLALKLGKKDGRILEVAAADISMLQLFPKAALRISLHKHKPVKRKGIQTEAINFLDWKVTDKFDLALCINELQKFKSPEKAAARLRRYARVSIVAVPYRREAGKGGKALHNNIDTATLYEWFQKEPNYQYICREVESGDESLIQVYEHNDIAWQSLRERSRLRSERKALDTAMAAKNGVAAR